MSSLKAVLWLFFFSVMCMGGFVGWAQKGPPTGEGFVLTLKSSAIHTLEQLEGQRVCGGPASLSGISDTHRGAKRDTCASAVL